MDPQDAIDMVREAIMLGPVDQRAGVGRGLDRRFDRGLIQALTQVQEQTVAFVPKLVAMILVLCLTLPGSLRNCVDYAHDLFLNIPHNL